MELLARVRPALCGMAAAVALLMPHVCHAEDCPWLNAATARGVLGGPVTMSVQHQSATQGSCTFTRVDNASLSLEIEVGTPPAAPDTMQAMMKGCRGTRKLIGVGNEATACTLPSHATLTEQVIGRVRNQIFLVRWTMPSSHAPPDSRREDTMQWLAEAVAGNLF